MQAAVPGPRDRPPVALPTWCVRPRAGEVGGLWLQSNVYWSGLEYVSPASGFAWFFDFYHGSQNYGYRLSEFYAVAVRPGDVAASVPEPQALALMLLGLTAVGVARRRRPR